jgi:hypothetical protein
VEGVGRDQRVEPSGWKTWSSPTTAMRHYGGYRWTIWDYVQLTTELKAALVGRDGLLLRTGNRGLPRTSNARVENTVYSLAKTIATVTAWNRELPGWKATPPMPVIQGWKPSDCYEQAD